MSGPVPFVSVSLVLSAVAVWAGMASASMVGCSLAVAIVIVAVVLVGAVVVALAVLLVAVWSGCSVLPSSSPLLLVACPKFTFVSVPVEVVCDVLPDHG